MSQKVKVSIVGNSYDLKTGQQTSTVRVVDPTTNALLGQADINCGVALVLERKGLVDVEELQEYLTFDAPAPVVEQVTEQEPYTSAVELPKTDAPGAEAPVVEAQVTEQPATEQPVADTASADAPVDTPADAPADSAVEPAQQ